MTLRIREACSGWTRTTSTPQKLFVERPLVVHAGPDPTPTKILHQAYNIEGKGSSFIEFVDTTIDRTPPDSPHHLPRPLSTHSRPASPSGNARSSRPSITSSITSATVSVEASPDLLFQDSESSTRRPSLLTRLRSSTSALGARRPYVHLSDFQKPPEQPEKHFIDSVGMAIPGVSNREQCEHPRTHFITHWRLCEPIEYSTALADHGITYHDYSLLLNTLANFLDDLPKLTRIRRRAASWWQLPRQKCPRDTDMSYQHRRERSRQSSRRKSSASDLEDQYAVVVQQAEQLNILLREISCAWQRRDIPVMVCISSYSLFAPNRLSESLIQILHFSPEQKVQQNVKDDSRGTTRLSFIDPFAVAKSQQCSVAHVHSSKKRGSESSSSTLLSPSYVNHHQFQHRDKTRPWPLWPNSIPLRKRQQMNVSVERYGSDPYYRAWIRADINSRTKCTSYAKYMIERENNPFINKRLDYINLPAEESAMCGLLKIGRKDRSLGGINRKNYEHNRQLECRKTIESGGSRLRLVRFGFHYAIYPPHTPEMDELGLTHEKYSEIIRKIEDIRHRAKRHYIECVPNVFKSWTKIGRRSTTDSLNEVNGYIRQLNAAGRRIVWTIEKLPGVYDNGTRSDKEEWEISAWNGEEPLELLIQLEKWGIIEQRLNIDDDE